MKRRGFQQIRCVIVFWTMLSVVPVRAEDHVAARVSLDCKELNESSGLAISRRDPSCVWTHNDSSGKTRLYSFDRSTGKQVGRVSLKGCENVDWEDMTTANVADTNYLIVADCGDNEARREQIELIRFEEPNPRKKTKRDADQVQVLRVTYATGPVDCEAVWYDADSRQIILVGKGKLPWVGVFAVPMDAFDVKTSSPFVATKFATLPLAMATAADVDPTTGDVWIVSYWQAFRFAKADHRSFVTQLATVPTAMPLPPWRQIEGVAVDEESQVWITSEGEPTPLGRLLKP